jgi:hypothetical protein
MKHIGIDSVRQYSLAAVLILPQKQRNPPFAVKPGPRNLKKQAKLLKACCFALSKPRSQQNIMELAVQQAFLRVAELNR